MDFIEGLFNSGFGGANAAVGGVLTDPSVQNIAHVGRSVAVEALPGNQITDLDAPVGRAIAAADELKQGQVANAGVRSQTNAAVGRARENAAELGLGRGARMAGNALIRRLPGIGSRIVAGATATGGIAAPILGALGVAEVADAAIETVTGKGIVGWANDPAKIRGRSGAARAKA